jgi:hypothetical protein
VTDGNDDPAKLRIVKNSQITAAEELITDDSDDPTR